MRAYVSPVERRMPARTMLTRRASKAIRKNILVDGKRDYGLCTRETTDYNVLRQGTSAASAFLVFSFSSLMTRETSLNWAVPAAPVKRRLSSDWVRRGKDQRCS